MYRSVYVAALIAVLFSGAIFGFFYAWLCSTMWGLDRLPPGTAIAAMQAMNASVRNVVFAPAFFGTGPVLGMAAALAWRANSNRSALWLAAAAVTYVGGAMLPTLLVNVPMNEALALTDPAAPDAGAVWEQYSARWQAWNQLRTLFSAAALLMCGMGLLSLPRAVQPCVTGSTSTRWPGATSR